MKIIGDQMKKVEHSKENGEDFNLNVVDDGLDLNKFPYEGEETFENEEPQHSGKC